MLYDMPHMIPELSSKQLAELLEYNPETGELRWKRRPRGPQRWNTRWAGKPAFTTKLRGGYRMGRIHWGAYYAHRVIWALMTGAWPTSEIDHIDGDPSNNRWANLRLANTRSEQLINKLSHRSDRAL